MSEFTSQPVDHISLAGRGARLGQTWANVWQMTNVRIGGIRSPRLWVKLAWFDARLTELMSRSMLSIVDRYQYTNLPLTVLHAVKKFFKKGWQKSVLNTPKSLTRDKGNTRKQLHFQKQIFPLFTTETFAYSDCTISILGCPYSDVSWITA